ncbi:hypothetical protein FBY35_4204 [Streptomyces sp. SLBN-118]|nr:hypothetical protein FBY35_4204 [Streptomyces sp. SLBN-118]
MIRSVGEDRIFPTLPTPPAAYGAWRGETENGGSPADRT